jgi:hypothetical protein
MNELAQIIFIFFIFQFFLFIPLNVFKEKKYLIEVSALNLILNCNILLILSLLPISINKYSNLLIIIYFLIFLKKYLFSKLIYNLKKNFIDFLIFFIIFLTVSINIASTLDLGWDAKYFYYIKSLFFIENQTFLDLKNFSYNAWHPHLGSFIWAFFWDLSFLKIEYFGRLFYAFIFIFSFLYASDNLFNNKNTNLIIFLLITIFGYTYDKFSGLQEILVFSLLIIVSKLLYKINEKENENFIIYIILTCNLFIWIKAEGLAYALILIIILNINKLINLKYKFLINIFFLIFFLVKFILYKNFNIEINAQPYYFDYILKLNPYLIIHKLKYILTYSFYYITKNIFFASGILVIVINNLLLEKKPNYIKLLKIYLLLNLAFILFAYLFRDMEIEYSIKTTMNRIIFMSSGFYIFTLLLFIKELKIKFK